jgi:hypothetical protein
MDRVQPSRRDPMVDRVRAEAERGELAPRDDTVLPAREGRDRPVDGSRGTLTATMAADVPLDGHPTMVADTACRISTRLHQHCATRCAGRARPPSG